MKINKPLVTLVGLYFCAFAVLIAPGLFGLYLAFHASIILGIAVLILQPTLPILGWAAIVGRTDICEKIAAWLHLPV